MAAHQDINILQEISQKFNALTAKCPSFNGSNINIDDFLDDVTHYCIDTGRHSEQEMKQCLFYHLEGDAKEFYRIISQKSPSWQQLVQSLKRQYGTSPCEQYEAKNFFFNSKQQPGETFQASLINHGKLNDWVWLDVMNAW